MLQGLRTVTVVVPDYDQAIAWYTEVLGFSLTEDQVLSPDKRWVVVAPPGSANAPNSCRFLLALATNPQQQAAIGNQTGGRVGFFLTSTDFWVDYHRFLAAGVRFLEEPRQEAYGWVVQFADPWGNKYDLLEATIPSEDQNPLRYGFIGIIVPHHLGHGPEIQRILSDHAELIQGRMGLPHLENDTVGVITLIVRATPDGLSSLTGRLGRLKGITVKSGMAPLVD